MASNETKPNSAADRFSLDRFLAAQEGSYDRALQEIKSGGKRTHWMWYIFPQIDGLGYSATSRLYAIKSREEAVAYLDHPVLGARLRECASAVDALEGPTVTEIFGDPDDLKLRSCATLFAAVSPPDSVFDRLIAKYFGGERDPDTLRLLENGARADG